MSLEPGIFLLVLLAAVCHASWNALVKTGGDKLVIQTLVIAIPGAISAFFLPFLPLPALESWPYLIVSMLLHLAYFLTLIYAYEHGDLSQVYPIARGVAPALVAVFAWVAASEALSLRETIGLAIISGGIISLSRLSRLLLRGETPRDGELRAIAFAALTALLIGSYSLCDGLGVRHSGAPISFILWLFFLSALPLGAVTLYRRRGRLWAAFAPYWGRGVAGGLLSGSAYGIVIWAMAVAPLAHVVALRETSVIIAAVIGTRLLREPFGRPRILAAVAIACGVGLLNLQI